MAKVGIFFGSTTGVTEDIAHKIAEKIDGAEVFNIDGNEDKLEDYDVLLLGTSTWGFGDLQDDWAAVLDDLASKDLSGKKVGYFGSGIKELSLIHLWMELPSLMRKFKKLVQQSLEKLQQKDMNSANQEQQKMENFWDLL